MICRHPVASWSGHWPKKGATPSLVARAFFNPYKVLQVSEDADPSQIKRAYRKLALRHHPDINEEPSAEQDFLRIQEAYEVLTKKTQAEPSSNGWDFHDWYWDFTMSHRWDSHWKKHGRTGPSPFAATPSHRQQWQAQLTKLKQRAQQRRTNQQAAHHTEQAKPQHAQQQQQQQQQQPEYQHGESRQSPEQQQQQQSERHSQTGKQGRGHQQEPTPGMTLEGHQQAQAVAELDSLGWQEHHQTQAEGVEPAVNSHAPLHWAGCSPSMQEHASPSLTHTLHFKGDSIGNSWEKTQAVELESHTPGAMGHSTSLLVVMLTQQLLQQLQWQEQSLEWGVHLHSLMAAVLQHVQGTHTGSHNGSHPVGGSAWLTEGPAPHATADLTPQELDVGLIPNSGVMPAAQEQATSQLHEPVPACTREMNTAAPSTVHMVADQYQSSTQGQSNESAPFQTRHSQVQSQLAGLKRRAARKHSL